jgi:nickel-dependent lactate racemase
MDLIVRQRPVWSLVTISDAGVIQWADFGPAADVTAQAFQKADQWNMRTVDRMDFMIVSPGGLPNDVDLYIAQRALELTSSVVKDGGQILFLAACPKGIGSKLTSEQFEQKITRPLSDILHSQRGRYHLFEHKPYRFALLIQRLEKLWLHSLIPNETVTKIHLFPAQNPQDIVTDRIRQQPDTKILLVDGANKLLLMPRGG